MGVVRVEGRKKRLFGVRAVTPASRLGALVPSAAWFGELVVGLPVVAAVPTFGTQILGETLDVRWRQCGMRSRKFRNRGIGVGGAHVAGPYGDRVHAGDHRRASKGADSGGRERQRVDGAFGSQSIHDRGSGHRVAVAAVEGVGVLERNPQDVRSFRIKAHLCSTSWQPDTA